MTAVPESQILKPRSPTITDENEWPEFTLTNVDCHDSQGELVSLLDADEKNPLTVTGKLVPLPKSQSHLQLRNTTSRISVERVLRYAYGQSFDEEGKTTGVSFWAVGQAGWFKIEPSRRYKDTFQRMSETIEKLYFLVDTYQKKPRTDIRELFLQYAEDEDLDYADDAADLFYADRMFLIHAILKDIKEHHLLPSEYDWTRTSFYEHIRELYPKDFSAISARLSGKPLSQASKNQASGKQPKTRGRSRKDLTSTTKDDDSRSGEDMSKSTRRAAGQPVKRDDAWWKARAILEFMHKAHALKLVSSKSLTIDQFAVAMARSYDVEDEETAATYIQAYADQLILMMETKKYEVWTTRPIYEELKNARVSVVDMRRMQQLKLQPLRAPLMPSDSEVSSESSSASETSEEQEEQEEEPPAPTGRARKGRLSIMRPKPSKYSGKGAKRQSKGPSAKVIENDENDERDIMEVDGSSSSSRRTSKRKREPEKITAEHSSSESERSLIVSDDNDELSRNLPLRWKRSASSTESTVPPPIIATLLQTKEASLSPKSDIWQCPFPSCIVKIFGSDSPTSQRLIVEHKRTHRADPDDHLMALVQSEARDDLPVSNLLKKIQEMAQLKQDTMPVIDGSLDKSAFPQRIKQRY